MAKKTGRTHDGKPVYRFKNGALAVKKDNGQFRIFKGSPGGPRAKGGELGPLVLQLNSPPAGSGRFGSEAS